VVLLGGLLVGCGNAGSTATDADGGTAGGETTGDGTAGATAPCTDGRQSGFVMPNPASTGLPNPASYTTNGDGTVTDNVTGLVWQGTVDPGSYTQAQAATYCASLGGAWRLPTRVELVSLVDFTIASPGVTINQTYFPSTPAAEFWTSSPAAGDSSYAWLVAFDGGIASIGVVQSANRVRCVEAGPRARAASKCEPTRYQVQAGGLVLDSATGLTWQQNASGDSYAWSDATASCAGLGAGWRLPSLTELQTIVDDTTFNPAIDQTAFPNTPGTYFWTSSAYGSDGAYYVFFDSGFTGIDGACVTFSARCVR
jgi:hypothetical protein